MIMNGNELGLDDLGLTELGQIHRNLSIDDLIDEVGKDPLRLLKKFSSSKCVLDAHQTFLDFKNFLIFFLIS